MKANISTTMTLTQFNNLKINQKVFLTTNQETLNNHGISTLYAGQECVIVRTNATTDTHEVQIMADGSRYHILPNDLQPLHGKQIKVRFNKTNVAEFIKIGAETKLKTELTTRVQQARIALNNAAAPETFHKSVKEMRELIRQATLIRNAIKTEKK